VDLEVLTDAFGLPGPLEVISHHPGSSGVWRVGTRGRDCYAVKVLRADDGWTRDRVRDQALVEVAASRAGLAVPEPVLPRRPGLGLRAELHGHLVEVHRWVDVLPGDSRTDDTALHRWLGQTLAILHTLLPAGRDDADARRHAYRVHPITDWTDWVEQAHRLGLPWAGVGDQLLTVLPALTDTVRDGLGNRSLPWCLTHRDVNPPNVLHTPDGPVLCDFGYAGPDVGWFEAVSAAVSFAAPGLLPAYLAAGGRPGPTGPVALARAVGSTANWLAYSMWVSLGHRDTGDDERRAATTRVPRTARDLLDLVRDGPGTRQRLIPATGDPAGDRPETSGP